jgi:hypothetical protein
MKSVLYSSLSALVLCLSLSTPARAEATQTTPFNLAHLARQGYFQEQNIRSHARLRDDLKSGQIKAEDVVTLYDG